MRGLQKYSHQERELIIQEMLPLIQAKFGDNLIALAAQASYARNEDADYSDLELIAFVREMPPDKKVGGMGRIFEGLLVELIWMTREHYLQNTKEPNPNWYISGSDRLLAFINKPFIDELNAYQIIDLREKCLRHAASLWHDVQESTGKTLNAIRRKNRFGISLLAHDMYFNMLKVLSFLNCKPYTTFAKFIEEAQKFPTKPAHFIDLTRLLIKGEFQDFSKLQKTVERVFGEFEIIFDKLGFELYDENLDPSKPGKKWL